MSKLIVFPGAGNPDNSLYEQVYFLIKKEALNYGYQDADISLRYPGHYCGSGELVGSLSFDGAVNRALLKLQEYEIKKENYSLLGRSFGTIVACYCAAVTELKYLQQIILWGPPPYWLLWMMFKKDIQETSEIAINKGLQIDESLFASIVPIESLLPKLNYSTVIATGSEDPYSKPAYLTYLKSFVGNKNNFQFRVVEGAIHEVTYNTDVWRKYVETLFA